ncbi:MAG TPA: nitroreductase/quinone reductase family protein [Ktedonobacteraceae bacterium]
MTTDLSYLAREDFCYLTTTGRISGRPHTIEIWFALNGQTLYMLAGGMERSDWVRNAWQQPDVTVKVKERVFAGQARPVKDAEEDALARQLIGEKYHEEEDLDEWLKTALPVAVDLLVDLAI